MLAGEKDDFWTSKKINERKKTQLDIGVDLSHPSPHSVISKPISLTSLIYGGYACFALSRPRGRMHLPPNTSRAKKRIVRSLEHIDKFYWHPFPLL